MKVINIEGRIFIEFTVRPDKRFLVNLDQIEAVEIRSGSTQVNGNDVDESYEEIFKLFQELSITQGKVRTGRLLRPDIKKRK